MTPRTLLWLEALVVAAVALVGDVSLDSPLWLLAVLALIWVAHIGVDRLFAFGLTYASGCKDTHLTAGLGADAGPVDG